MVTILWQALQDVEDSRFACYGGGGGGLRTKVAMKIVE